MTLSHRAGRFWLSAGDAIAQATYAELGFQLIDTRLNYLAAAR